MKDNLRKGIALAILPQILFVKWFGNHPEWVEQYYSKGLYPEISGLFRWAFGWIPFSIGELVYSLLLLSILWYLVHKWRHIKRKPFRFLINVVAVLSVFYFTFHLVWGLNYYRRPIAENLAITDSITKPELLKLTERLIQKTNTLQFSLTGDSTQMVNVPYPQEEIFQKTVYGYAEIKKRIPFLTYTNPSIKASGYSTLSSYLGIGGYLNPFTNEAQVNALTPAFRLPVISGHEIGHQIGYAAENETNFIGYLVTVRHKDPYFQYSAYAYALSHCLSAIARENETEFEQLYSTLNNGVKANYQELRDFYTRYENPFEPIFESVFSTFLKANNQADGIQSYGRVVSLMVGYHKKHPI